MARNFRKKPSLKRPFMLLTGAAGLSLAASAFAQTPSSVTGSVAASHYLVTINTSSLDPAVLYTLEYQLTDGSFSGNNNTQLLVRSLNFNGGTTSAATTTGDAFIGTGGAITFDDAGAAFPSADYLQSFKVPSTTTKFLSYSIDLLRSGTESGNSPDGFSFSLLNSAGVSALPTADPFGTTLLTLDFAASGSPLQFTNYNTGLLTFTPSAYTFQGGGTPAAPTTGSFSAGFSPNLTATTDTTTALVFGGSGSTAYTATNNLGVLQLSSLTFSSTASVNETIAGSGLNFVTNTNTAQTPTLTQNTAGAFTVSAPVTLTNNTSLVNAGAITFSGIISGAGTLTKSGSGTVTLTAADTYAGATAINGGTVILSSAGTANTAITINQNSALTLDNSAANTANRSGGKAVTMNGGTYSLIGSSSASTTETDGALAVGQGGGVLTLTPKAGQSLLLTDASYARTGIGGQIIFRSAGLGTAPGAGTGTVKFTTAPAITGLGTTAATVLKGALADNLSSVSFATYDVNGVRALNSAAEQAVYTGTGQTTTNTTLSLSGGTTAVTGQSVSTLAVDNSSGSAQTLTLNTAALTATNGLLFTGSGATTLGGQAVAFGSVEGFISATGTGLVTLSSALTGGGSSNTPVDLGGTGSYLLKGAITLGNGNSLNINTIGTVTLGAALTGTPNINNGTFKLTTGGVLQSTKNVNIASGGTLDLNGFSPTFNGVNDVITGIASSSGVLTNSSAAPVTVTIGSGGTTFTGNITGPLSLIKNGMGAQTLAGAGNAYTGTTTVNAGTLTVTAASSLGSIANALIINSNTAGTGASTVVNLNSSQTVGSLSGVVSQAGVTSGTNTATLNINNPGTTLTIAQTGSATYGGTIAGLGGVTLASGTLTLSGTNSYTGGTIVSAGTLLGNTGSYGSGAVSVGTGAVVDYSQATPGAASNNITGTGKVTFGGVTGGANGSGGALTYTGQDSAAGGTTVNGALVLSNANGSALTGPVTAATGSAVGLGSDDQIAPTSNMTLAGGKLAANGHDEGTAGTPGLGTLTLSASSPAGTASTLDFGDASGTNANTLAFSDSGSLSWTGTVQLLNYTDGADKLYIGTTNSLTTQQLMSISFGTMKAGQDASGKITFAPAPEPSGWASMLVGVGVLGSVIARKRRSVSR